MTEEAKAARGPERAAYWLIGLFFGIALVLPLVDFPTIGLLLALVVIVAGWFWRRSMAYESGVLIGIGSTMLGLLAWASSECGAFNNQPGSSCTMPDLVPWVVGSLALVGVGLILGWFAARRARGTAP